MYVISQVRSVQQISSGDSQRALIDFKLNFAGVGAVLNMNHLVATYYFGTNTLTATLKFHVLIIMVITCFAT